MTTVLAIVWHEVFVQIIQFIISLSILVVLHEFGHYIAAKKFGCRVEKFYLFFDPYFSLFKKKVGETEYGVGWLPLGGYVKIAGMIDESMDTEAMKEPAKDWEFRSKPAWQRLIIMLGGIIVNVLLAIFIYSMVLYKWGSDTIPMSSVKYGISFQDSIYNKIGFQNGDKLLSVDSKPVESLEGAMLKVIMGKTAQVERNGNTVDLKFPENLIGSLVESKKKGADMMLMPRMPSIVGEFGPKSLAKDAGILINDEIVSVNGVAIRFADELRANLERATADSVTLLIKRNADTIHLVSKITNEKKLGIGFLDNKKLAELGCFSMVHKNYNFFESFPAGVKLTYDRLNDYISQFKKILNPKTGAYKGVGGFKAIASNFSTTWDWERFWSFTAFLSIMLAFMNLLPIPALDGGHVMFTLYEIIFRRKPNEKFLEYAQMIGMILLLSLIVLINVRDWIR